MRGISGDIPACIWPAAELWPRLLQGMSIKLKYEIVLQREPKVASASLCRAAERRHPEETIEEAIVATSK
jgi:hypothetical protein